MKERATSTNRRRFLRKLTVGSLAGTAVLSGVARAAQTAASPGVKSEIRVHLHQNEDEIIFIRMGTGVATLGDREVPVAAGATVYVPQGVWHGLRNDSQAMLGMTAIYSPVGFEQIFKDRLLHPNRTPDEAAAVQKKHGIVYRERP